MSSDDLLIRQRAHQMRKKPTPAEKQFWEKVRHRRFEQKKCNRQFLIAYKDAEGNKRCFIPDFYCHEARLVIELDGEIHQYQKEYDQARKRILGDLGFQVLRFKNEEVIAQWEK